MRAFDDERRKIDALKRELEREIRDLESQKRKLGDDKITAAKVEELIRSKKRKLGGLR